MIGYFAPLDGTSKLYKLDYSLEAKEDQLYAYMGDCFWSQVPNQSRLRMALRRIEEYEAQEIIEEIEGSDYYLLDGQVYVYD